MRSFRGLDALRRRLGLVMDTGAAIRSLPYAEGQVLATLADDWRALRIPPLVQTFGWTGTSPLVALRNSGIRLTAGASAVHLVDYSTDARCRMGIFTPAAGVSNLAPAAGFPSLLTGTPPDVGPIRSLAAFESYDVAGAHNSLGSYENFNVSYFSGANEASMAPRSSASLWLLPGEAMCWTSLTNAQAFFVSVIWRELPGDDTLTAAPPKP